MPVITLLVWVMIGQLPVGGAITSNYAAHCSSPWFDHIVRSGVRDWPLRRRQAEFGRYRSSDCWWRPKRSRWCGPMSSAVYLAIPGKIEITCPVQDKETAVLLLVGQSNAANSQGQLHQSADDRVVNFVNGRCYRAASPLLGADGQKGEPWTLLGNKLVQSGLYRTVILIPAAVGASSVRRWAKGRGPQRDAGGSYRRGQGTLHHHRGAPGPGGDRFRLAHARRPGIGRISNP